jgi:tyrosyl-DNA phosphodiesterase 2
MGRDALFVDIPVSAGGRSTSKRSIRLCTTHLESLYGSETYRASQLATISRLTKETRAKDHDTIAIFVGGDMNAITPFDYHLHKANELDLRDAWEDIMTPPIPLLRPFQKDMSFGQARGNT